MATSIIEGIDNEVLFVVSVFVAFVAIYLVHLLYNSNINLNSGQNTPNTAADSVSFSSSEEHARENTTDEQGRTNSCLKTWLNITGPEQSMKIDDRKSDRSIDFNRYILINCYRLVSANR